MQETNNNNSATEGLSKKTVSIGAILVNARNAAALSQADIAEQINLPVNIIQALETDDYDNLPGATYVRGYLRNYARLVGVNEEGLAKLYIEQHHCEPVVEAPTRSAHSYDPAILWSTAAVFSILFGLVITWWFEYNTLSGQSIELVSNENVMESNRADNTHAGESLLPSEEVSIDQEASSEELDASEDLAINETTARSSTAGARQMLGQVTDSETEVITADQQHAMEEASQNPTLVSSIEGAQVLTVTYVEKSWTEIRDADSNTLMQGLIEPGVVRDLNGKPPFEIFLGNAPGVVIEINGLYFDHSQYSRSNRTARFQISSTSLN
ncbi:MAG: RodZ domain-containing protein [Gammaproteobacteria bacterium]